MMSAAPDGILGPRTRSAIELYQKQDALLVDGQPSEALLRHMDGRSSRLV